MPDEKYLDIILASHDHPILLMQAIEALYAHTPVPFHLTIVDDSTDPMVAFFLQSLDKPNVSVIHSDEPYVHGNQIINIGLNNTKSAYLCYLGNSTRVEPQWADAAWQIIQTQPKVGIIGFKLLKKGGTIEHAGMYWEPWMPWHMNIGVDALSHHYSFIRSVPAVGFALVMFRREVFPDGLDEKTFLGFRGYDDVSLCFEAKERGWEILYCGLGTAYHLAGATRHDNNPKFEQECEHNRQVFLERWGGTEEAKKSVVITKVWG